MQKQCSKCKTIKPIEGFYKHIRQKDGYNSWCKACMIKQSAEYQRPNANAERGSKSAERRKAIQARYREKNREKVREIQRRYVHENSAKVLARTRKYQCNKLRSIPKWLTKEHWKQMESIYLKAEEMRKQEGIIYEVDHIIPLQGVNVIGLHVPWNLQIIERKINRAKHNRIKN